MTASAALLVALVLVWPARLLAARQEWPLRPIKISVTSADDRRSVRKIGGPRDCQPEVFDPQTSALEVSDPARPRGGFKVPGLDGCTLLVDGWQESGDRKTVLRAPYSLTRYSFVDAISQSDVLELRRDGVRYALYTHVDQFRFSPDSSTLVLVSWVKTEPEEWRLLRRVIDVASRRVVALPEIGCTANIADVNGSRLVTYDPDGPACVWGLDGRLQAAFEYPSKALSNEGRFGESLGLLPAENSTVFYVQRPGEGGCTVLLQDVARPAAHRRLILSVPRGDRSPSFHDLHACQPGTGIQIDWADLTLQGGHMRFRTSSSQRGDVNSDWGPWQTAR